MEVNKILLNNIEYDKVYSGDQLLYEKYIPDYLTFKSVEPDGSVIGLYNSNFMAIHEPNISYSTDGGNTWTDWKANSYTPITIANGNKVKFKGENPNGFNSNAFQFSTFRITGSTEAHGNVMSLVDGKMDGTKDIPNCQGCFCSLFNCCTSLTTAPVLPATTLAKNCYLNMFNGCTSLTTAPVLPATTLTENCYMYMFQGCSSLTEAPALPATELANYCYQYMFAGCRSLTEAPELPATNLADSCYDYMFYGTNVLPDCTNIDFGGEQVVQSGGLQGLFAGTKITDEQLDFILKQHGINDYSLPATTLAEYCYENMFQGCSGLVTAPVLPATTLASGCYSGMFGECNSLVTAPELPATTLAKYCYSGMFRSCTSLVTVPSNMLPATELAESCYGSDKSGMFVGCTSLTTAPELPAITLVNECYSNMFSGCTNLNYIKCLATDISVSNCTYDWVNGVNSTGQFVVPNSMRSTWDTMSSGSGKPTNFTYVDA